MSSHFIQNIFKLRVCEMCDFDVTTGTDNSIKKIDVTRLFASWLGHTQG